MKDTTLLFLIKRNPDTLEISHILLAMKKRGFGMNRWNGVGGKLEPGESIEEGVLREANEEIGVVAHDLKKVARLAFSFALKPEWNQCVHVFFSDEWEFEPAESEEMRPEWFEIGNIPFDEMWPDDPFWLPQVLEGKLVQAAFTFGDQDIILEQQVKIVPTL